MSSQPPCELAYTLASATIGFATFASVLASISFGFYSYTLHKNPNKKFSNTTKFDVESSTWVLVLSAIGALAGASSVVANYQCGSNCPAATLACNTLAGQYGASMVAAMSAASAAGLKILSYFHQMYIAKTVVSDDDQ